MAIGAGYGVGPVLFGGIDGASPLSFVTSDSAAIRADGHAVGDRVDHAGEEYLLVHNAGASIAAQGNFMVLSSLSGFSLTISSLSAQHMPICVVKHADIPAGGYGWGLVRGISQVLCESTMPTGAFLTPGQDGVFKTYATSANTDTVKGYNVGQVLSSGSGSTASMPKAYVRCWG